MNDYSHHIIHTLRKAGYTSALAGVQHIANMCESPWRTIGYDQYLGQASEAHVCAKDFLKNAPEQPFFLSVGFTETHREFPELDSIEAANYSIPPQPLPDTPEIREDMARFKKSARILDEKIGMVLDALERNHQSENTLVICTTDHGIAFPGMKCNLTDGGIGVMLIMRGPGGFTGGRVCDSLISQIDLFPTICDLIGIDHPDWLEGTSIMPIIDGKLEEVRDAIFAEVNYHAAYEPMRGVRTKRWKYIRRFDGRTKAVLPNCDDSPSKSVWMKNGWADLPVPEEALYDLIFDPNETNNLVGKHNTEEILSEMRTRLNQWVHDTNDPLLQGHVPAPERAVMNDPDGISPKETCHKTKF